MTQTISIKMEDQEVPLQSPIFPGNYKDYKKYVHKLNNCDCHLNISNRDINNEGNERIG